MKSDKEKLIELCRDLLENRRSIIESSIEILRFRFTLGPEDDPDFITFVVIESETDHLPVGTVRSHWASDALEKKDKEIQKAEDFYRQSARTAAASLIEKFKET